MRIFIFPLLDLGRMSLDQLATTFADQLSDGAGELMGPHAFYFMGIDPGPGQGTTCALNRAVGMASWSLNSMEGGLRNGSPIISDALVDDHDRRSLYRRTRARMIRITAPEGRSATRVEAFLDDVHIETIEQCVRGGGRNRGGPPTHRSGLARAQAINMPKQCLGFR